MTLIAADCIHRWLGGLSRRPVLMVMILLLVIFGMAVLAVWLGTGNGPNPRKSELLYIAGISAADRHREFICVNYS